MAESRVLAEISVNVAVAGAVLSLQPGSPSNSERMMDQGGSSCSEGRSSITSEVGPYAIMDLEELLAEIKAGHCTTRTIRDLNYKLRKPDCRDIVRSSGIASSLIALLLSSNLTEDAAAAGAPRPSSVDELQVLLASIILSLAKDSHYN